MSLKFIQQPDTLRAGSEKSNYNDDWLRSLIKGSVKPGYEAVFSVPSNPWVINHYLNTEIFTYSCWDLSDNEIHPTAVHIDSEDRITVIWPNDQAGKIRILFGFDGWVYPSQSEVGWPSDENWDDGITAAGVITPHTTIADAIDAVNEAAVTPPSAGSLQSAYNAGNTITVSLSSPVQLRATDSPSSKDILLLTQEDTAGGSPLVIDNQPVGSDYSINLSGGTRTIGSTSGTIILKTAISGDIHSVSANDVIAQLGDDAGVKRFSVYDSSSVEVAHIDSDGYMTTAGTVTTEGVDTAKYYNYAPIAGEYLAPYNRPQTYVNSTNNHLYYVDPLGNEYDLIQGIFGVYRAEEIIIVDLSTWPGYYDLADIPLSNSEFVILNGVTLTKDHPPTSYDYTVGGMYPGDPANRVRFNIGVDIKDGAKIHFRYLVDFSYEMLGEEVYILPSTGAPSVADPTFTLGADPIIGSEYVMLNGVVLTKGALFDYQVMGNQVVLNSGVSLVVGDKVHIKYKYY